MPDDLQEPAPPAPFSLDPAAPSRIDRREKAAADVLRTFIRDAHADRFGPVVHGQAELTIRFNPPLAKSLERGDRQQARRTRHAEARRGSERPVHKALEDAVSASPENHFSDERTNGIVVCEPQGRAHVFNIGGRHITSFSLTPEAVAYRVRTSR